MLIIFYGTDPFGLPPQRVGDGYEAALKLLQEAGYAKASYFLDRKRHEVSIPKALASLR